MELIYKKEQEMKRKVVKGMSDKVHNFCVFLQYSMLNMLN